MQEAPGYDGRKPAIVDLFAGCGGMSLGFEMAGFRVSWANEIDPSAADTYGANHPGVAVVRIDAREIDDWTQIASEDDELPVGVVGGPPCQAFSLCGTRDPNDPRCSLFMEFARCVRQLRPDFFVMENVPGIMSMETSSGERVAKIVIAQFRDAGYDVFPETANAIDCGVPQSRERAFFVGFSEPLGVRQEDVELPSGVESQVTVDMAISDLPPVESGQGEEEQPYAIAAGERLLGVGPAGLGGRAQPRRHEAHEEACREVQGHRARAERRRRSRGARRRQARRPEGEVRQGLWAEQHDGQGRPPVPHDRRVVPEQLRPPAAPQELHGARGGPAAVVP